MPLLQGTSHNQISIRVLQAGLLVHITSTATYNPACLLQLIFTRAWNTPWPVLVLSAFSHAATTWVSANCHCSGGSIRLASCHVIKFRSSSCLGQVLDSWPVLLNLPLVVCFFFASFVVPAEPQQAFFLVKREKGIISWLYAPVVAGKGEPGTPQVQCAPPSWP